MLETHKGAEKGLGEAGGGGGGGSEGGTHLAPRPIEPSRRGLLPLPPCFRFTAERKLVGFGERLKGSHG